MAELIIGVDGGGTKTNLVAVDIQTGCVAAAATCGSIHISTMGEPTALENLKQGLDALRLRGEDRVLAVAIGDPSIDDSDHDTLDTPLSAAAAKCCAGCRVFVKSDVFMAMYACFGGQAGAFLVSGTGSMGVALTEAWHHGGENSLLTVGGWAMPTSDPGSGYDIALQGIQAALHGFDGVAGHTELCEALLAFGKADSPRALIPLFNNGTLTRGEVAQFAKCVDACARHGDETAVSILESAGHSLAKYALRLLGCLPVPRIGVYGSVLLQNETVYRSFETDVLSAVPNAQILCPDRTPEYGAAMFACDALGLHRKWE